MKTNLLRCLLIGATLSAASPVWAVYAPIPESQQGQEFTYDVRAGITYDSNIFASATQAISSTIYQVIPEIVFNDSLTQDDFLTLSYRAELDDYSNRPGKKLLDSHYVAAKLAHSFSKTSDLYLSDAFSYVRDPEADLNGLPINVDQSYVNNTANGSFNFAPTELTTVTLKGQDVYYHYLNSVLSNELDRNEDLAGLEGAYSLSPDLKAAVEYRHQDVIYANNGSEDNKETEFAMGGLDYNPGPKTTVGFRLGAEYRTRSGASDITTPYAEVTAKYSYGKQSFVSFGYTYDLEETSDPAHFTDEKVNRFSLNVQHALSPVFVASASFDYEPSTLLGRPDIGQTDITEDTTRVGVALSYVPNKNWVFSATYDYDNVDSGIASRDLNRSRTGVSATYTF